MDVQVYMTFNLWIFLFTLKEQNIYQVDTNTLFFLAYIYKYIKRNPNDILCNTYIYVYVWYHVSYFGTTGLFLS